MCPSPDVGSQEALDRVVADLARSQAATVDDALGRVPALPGLYAWWLVTGATLPGVPTPTGLLYVGIAPSRATSGASLRSRLRQHTRGNISSSTFRRSLAALLWQSERWTPFTSPSGKLRLTPADNDSLSHWQRTNLRVAWSTTETPWSVEPAVIAALQPPLNLDHNAGHEFWKEMRSARALLADMARRRAGG